MICLKNILKRLCKDGIKSELEPEPDLIDYEIWNEDLKNKLKFILNCLEKAYEKDQKFYKNLISYFQNKGI